MERITGIYEFINTLTGDIYVGQSVNILKRYNDHVLRGSNSLIDTAIKEYGIDNFEFIIYKVIDTTNLSKKEIKHILDEEEIKRINELDCCINVSGHGYNKAKGGGGSSGCASWNKGKTQNGHPCSEQTKTKISKANKGRKRTPEQCLNISIAARKRYENQEERDKISKANLGKAAWNKGRNDYLTEESMNKIRTAALKGAITNGNKTRGKSKSNEFKEKVSEGTKEAMHTPENWNKFLSAVQSEDFRNKQREKMTKYWSDNKRKEQSLRQTGYKWFNDGIKNYRVYPKDYEYYISNGYNQGFLKCQTMI